MLRRLLASILLLGWTALAAGATLTELLQKAKEEYRSEKYAESLKTLDELEVESGKPGLEQDRAALEPILAFYRGASLAATGRKEEAKPQFRTFLRVQPNAALDPAVHSKRVIAAFEEARKSAPAADAQSPSVADAYRAFPAPTAPEAETPGDGWAEGPVRFLITPAEKQDFTSRFDVASRSDFVSSFWKSRDPRPETPENELRLEFQKRVAFADARFRQGETRGSLTDRGMVFVLLGPPTYAGRKPATSGKDTISRPAPDSGAPGTLYSGTPGSHMVTKLGEARSWLEVWHYRREVLPASVPYQQVDIEFLTKEGYGENVLQRDPQTLDTLERAKALVHK